ncbi:MAG: chlorophyll synthase ChlG [Steroidobacteraceae bacterium]
MARPLVAAAPAGAPAVPAVIELLKPITWFPPMWAYACGLVSSGSPVDGRWFDVVLGVLLAGPLVCGTSQAVNDWFDRHVDAINEPGRPIPSGRIPGRWGLYVAILWTLLSIAVAASLGPRALAAGTVGLLLAWAYSAPPLRLKRNGWVGNGAVGACYEGLPWFTGAAILAGSMPGIEVVTLALLYSVGAHGIMTLNDFKSIEGDRRMGIASLPAQLGVRRAAWVACVVMAVPQAIVVAAMVSWGHPAGACVVAALLAAQLTLMRRFLVDPSARATWYSAAGVGLYVLGMMTCACALRIGAP